MSDQDAERVCGNCGASNALEARFCGICGQELLEAAASLGGGDVEGNADTNLWLGAALAAPPAALEPGNVESGNLEEREAAAQAQGEAIMQKRCAWCGGLSSWVAAVCEICGARFPVPGQDEAFRRAAEERLRQEEASLNLLRQQRRRGWRRFW